MEISRTRFYTACQNLLGKEYFDLLILQKYNPLDLCRLISWNTFIDMDIGELNKSEEDINLIKEIAKRFQYDGCHNLKD